VDVVESGGRGGDVVRFFVTHRLKSVLRPVKTGDTDRFGDALRINDRIDGRLR